MQENFATSSSHMCAKRASGLIPTRERVPPECWESNSIRGSRATDDDVVDGNEDQLHCVPDEPHDCKANSARHRNLLELLRIRLCAALDETPRVDAKLIPM